MSIKDGYFIQLLFLILLTSLSGAPQNYRLQVRDVFVIKGNAAVFRCHVPNFKGDFIEVVKWYKDDQIIVTSSSPKGVGRYYLLPSGDLYIKNVTFDDIGFYKCEAKDVLTKETLTSSLSGQLRVTESNGPIVPRIIYNSNSKVTVKEGQFAQLCCAAQAYPLPKFSWHRIDINGHISSILMSDDIYTSDGCLFITHTLISESGRHVCQASNIAGEERSLIDLEVIKPLNVSISPTKVVSEIGKAITFECKVSSSRDVLITWLKNGQTLKINSAKTLDTSNVFERISYFKINSINRSHSGMYQCLASNSYETAQSSAELKLAKFSPLFLSTFERSITKPGQLVSLSCAAIGSPLPQIHWYLDDNPVSENARFSYNDYVNSNEQVVSFLNISKVEVTDSGDYKCVASNEEEQVAHTSRIDVIGLPTLRNSQPIEKTVIAGKDITFRCPVAGYPIDYMKWEHKGQALPTNHRQQIVKVRNDDNRNVLKIKNIQKSIDQGTYTCSVTINNSEAIVGTINVLIKEAPLIDAQPLPPMIYANEGMRVKLVCSVVQGDHPISVRWLKNDNPIIASDEITLQDSDDYSLLTFKKVIFDDKGNYTCIASNQVASSSITSQLIVNVPPKWIIEPKNVTVVTFGQTVLIDCSSNGNPLPRIVWKKSNYHENKTRRIHDHPTEFKDIVSSYHNQVYSNGTLMILSAERDDTGYYMCQVNNGVGAGLSKVISIKVNIPVYFESKFASMMIKKGDTATLKCEALGDEPIEITWQKDKQTFDVIRDERVSIKEELNLKVNGITSYLKIKDLTRPDTALYTCLASNKFGSADYNLQLAIQESPDVPVLADVEDKTSRSAVIVWDAPYYGNSPITHYIIEYKREDEHEWKQIKTLNKELKATLNKLMPISNYIVRLRAVNHIGESESSKVINFKTEEEVPGGPPLNVRLEASGAQSLKVKWNAPRKEVWFGRIKGYYVGHKIADSQDTFSYKNYELNRDDDNEIEMSTYITNLKRQTTYEVFVQAYNSIGTGPRSDELRMTTLEHSPPTSPNLKIVSASYDSIIVGWDVNNNEQKDFILSYKTRLDHDWIRKEFKKVSKNEYRLDALKCGTNYNIYMNAKNSLGIGEPSKTIIGKTKGGEPVAPASLTQFCQVNSTWININLGKWVNSGCSIKKFIIKYKQVNGVKWIYINKSYFNNQRTVTINHLIPSQKYELVIIAENDAGSKEAKYELTTLNRNALSSNIVFNSQQEVSTPQANSSTLIIFNHYFAILLPIIISILMLITLFSIIIFCIRKQGLIESSLMNSNTLDRVSCSSIVHKSDINNESLAMSDYQCLSKMKQIADEERSHLSYYSSSGPKISTRARSEHDYAEPFIPISMTHRQKNNYIEEMEEEEDDDDDDDVEGEEEHNRPVVEGLYSSIKKNVVNIKPVTAIKFDYNQV